MVSRRLLYAQLVVVAILALLHILGLEFHLYWRFLWLDLVAHTLGGIWIGLFFFWVYTLSGRSVRVDSIIVGALLLGVGWEIFEVAAGLPREANYAFDTSLDL